MSWWSIFSAATYYKYTTFTASGATLLTISDLVLLLSGCSVELRHSHCVETLREWLSLKLCRLTILCCGKVAPLLPSHLHMAKQELTTCNQTSSTIHVQAGWSVNSLCTVSMISHSAEHVYMCMHCTRVLSLVPCTAASRICAVWYSGRVL